MRTKVCLMCRGKGRQSGEPVCGTSFAEVSVRHESLPFDRLTSSKLMLPTVCLLDVCQHGSALLHSGVWVTQLSCLWQAKTIVLRFIFIFFSLLIGFMANDSEGEKDTGNNGDATPLRR